jgi:WD40 repeat protein
MLILHDLCMITAHTMTALNTMAMTNSQDKTAKLWNAVDLTLIGTLKGHKRGIWRVEFRYIRYHIYTSSVYVGMHASITRYTHTVLLQKHGFA